MRQIGTAAKLSELGALVVKNGHSTQTDKVEAAFEMPETWALVCVDDRTFISVDDWFACGCNPVEIWSSETAENEGEMK